MTTTHPTSATRTVDGAEVPSAGRWAIDPAHTTVGFWVRHLGITKVRGRFNAVDGTITVAEDPTASSVEVRIDAASVDTREPDRDEHLRSDDFLAVADHPALTFASTGLTRRGQGWALAGDLTIRGTTRPVVLDLRFGGAAVDPWGEPHAMFSAETVIDREEFGLTWNQALEAGGVLVGRRVTIELEVSLVPVDEAA